MDTSAHKGYLNKRLVKIWRHSPASVLFSTTISLIAIMLLVDYILFHTLRSKAAIDAVTLKTVMSGTTMVIQAKASSAINIRGYSFDVSFPSSISVRTVSYNFGSVSIGLGDDTGSVSKVNSAHKMHIQGESTQSSGTPLSTSYLDLATITFVGSGSFTVSTSGKFYKIDNGSVLVPVGITIDGGSSTTPTKTPTPKPTITTGPGTPTSTPKPTNTTTPTKTPTPTSSDDTPTPTTGNPTSTKTPTGARGTPV
jgi:hypothetical protein